MAEREDKTTVTRQDQLKLKMKTDLVGDIIRYEEGNMDDDEVVDFFQRLVLSGVVWELQGAYQRQAIRLLESGQIHAKAWFGKDGQRDQNPTP